MSIVIGVPKEIKTREYRISLTPDKVSELLACGCELIVEKGAASGINIDDELYERAGAKIVDSADEIFRNADLVLKVKEPQAVECTKLRNGQILFTYLHLAPDLEQTQALMASGCSAIAYETVKNAKGRLPLLAPMSAIAGKLSIQFGASALEKRAGGKGILLGGCPGVRRAKVVIIGGGVAGLNAADIASGMGAEVVILDTNQNRLEEIDSIYRGSVSTLFSSSEILLEQLMTADLVVGSVLIPGASAPKIIKKDYIKKMKKGSVFVDISIDQGGCAETSRPTTHDNPSYEVDGVLHHCVTNMPGAVPMTSAYALSNATFGYLKKLVIHGMKAALLDDEGFLNGLNVHKGKLTNMAVAISQSIQYVSPRDALN